MLKSREIEQCASESGSGSGSGSGEDEFDLLDPYCIKNDKVPCEYSNPFYVPIESSKVKYSKIKDLKKDYEYVYILCLDNQYEETENNRNKINLFYEADSEISELVHQSSLISMVQAPFLLLLNSSIKEGLIIVEKDLLENYNFNSYNLRDTELVYLMLETKESHISEWLKIYFPIDNLKKFIEQKILTSYYDIHNQKSETNLISMLSALQGSDFWLDERKCCLTINASFQNRTFNLYLSDKSKDSIITIEAELQKILGNFANATKKITKNYPVEITDNKTSMATTTITASRSRSNAEVYKSKFVDMATNDLKIFFPVTKIENLSVSQSNIEELLIGDNLSEKERYYLICNLIINKDYCHYVLNNKNIMEANEKLFAKYYPVFKYLIGYAWISLYTEESLKKTKIRETDRFVFSLETASKLPVYPFIHDYPFMNPYFSFLVSKSTLNIHQNIGGVKQLFEYQKGIVDINEFRKRLNIFISGDVNLDLFDGVDWNNMVISGGIMAAILPKVNPLMSLFSVNPVMITDAELNRFFQEYYFNSDIDIACNHDNILDFIQNVKNIKDVIHKNLGKNINKADIIITPFKSVAVYINEDILKLKCKNGEVKFDYEYIMENKNKPIIKFYFYELYLEQKKISNNNARVILGDKMNDEEFFEIINYADVDNFTLVINNYSLDFDAENKTAEMNSGIEMVLYTKYTTEDGETKTFIRFSETLKYKISSKYLRHQLEIFRINGREFFSSISRFHLPCVRAYYNGITCYMLPSAITAYHTFTNIDFKYFVGSKDPVNIIDKYRRRGYGTILNTVELKQYIYYILNIGNYKKAYCIDNVSNIANIISYLPINHNLFKPRKYLPENFSSDIIVSMNYNDPHITYPTRMEHVIEYFNKSHSRYPNDFMKLCTINDTGKISQLKKWIIDASYDFLF